MLIRENKMNYRIKPSHAVLYDQNHNLCIGEIPGYAKLIKKAPKWLYDLLNLLDGSRSFEKIYEILVSQGYTINQTTFDSVIKELLNSAFMERMESHNSMLTAAEKQLYDRQMLYFSLVEKQGNPGTYYQEKLKQQHVIIFGVGGWGTWIALNLSLSGFGELTLVDGDVVELSNLNRQVLYTHENIGMAKVEAARIRLSKINPNTKVNIVNKFIRSKEESLTELIPSNCTLIVLAWENLAYFKEGTIEESIHNYAYRFRIPIIEIGADPLSVSVGPLYANDHSSVCFKCVKEQIRQRYYSLDENIQSLQSFRLKEGRQNLSSHLNSYQNASSLSLMSGCAVDQLIKFVTSCEKVKILGQKIQISLQSYNLITESFKCTTSCQYNILF